MKILMHYGQINQTILGCTVHHSGLGPLVALRAAACGLWARTAAYTAAATPATMATVAGFAQL